MIGERIKEIRTELGLTARDLAEKANVTPGYISQIERDLIRPSMNVLMKIADVLGVPVAGLFSQEESQERVVVIPRDGRTKIKFADVHVEYEFLTPFGRNRDRSSQMEVVHYTLKPHEWGSSKIMLHPESAECSVVLSGTLEYHVGDDVYTVVEGGCIYLPPNTPHQLYNPGDTVMDAIAVVSPAYF